MLSDESSSDSETGRFKGRTSNQEAQTKSSNQKEDSHRSSGRSRASENDRFRREFERRRDERERYERRSKEKQWFSRHSSIKRRHSRERTPHRRSRERSSQHRSRERPRHSDIRNRSKPRSSSRDKHRHSRSRSHKSPELKKELKEEVKHYSPPTHKQVDKFDRRSRDKSSSPEHRGKRSEIHKPEPIPLERKKSDSPIIVEEHASSDESVEVQPGSYYNMIPAVVKDKIEESPSVIKQKSESSEIDSSDDEKLRAKLLNLEKELQKTRKKKHKKRHKRKSSKSSKDRDRDASAVEVSSTTDIDKIVPHTRTDIMEVSSTQKSSQKESSEEGEITSDDDSQDEIAIDPTDLRHKLKRSKHDPSITQSSSKEDMCGPALPPQLKKKHKRSSSRDVEGPALPPHLQKHRNIGPSIPDNIRKGLANPEREVIVTYESSDEDIGIGPLPSGTESKWSEAHKRLEERALDMKIRKLDGHSLQQTNVKSREQWMLELPEAKAKYLGLEARSFRAKEGPDMSDRSSWTDTPEDKALKAAGIVKVEDPDVVLQREARARHIESRDEDQERAVRKHKKKHKREESLLELHQKKLKKKKKEDKDEKKERRPFSREVDLQVNRFDEAQKKNIIKKAQALDSRFSRGEAKYL
ncbi:GPALPP motifs-containing protein 1 isoform X2 [Hyposmocoma kahamanoa]|uniref:GPALPP motifs-containing protein 1 isoform X2 n=1 Tax=Hyposmocoma kahamanoa TaxID=1477025 RepID=UPI000E6D9F7A|nr:GPALPP motifs-containing protein 1 isoform X2 [Hyposmocoma kahamanoa]